MEQVMGRTPWQRKKEAHKPTTTRTAALFKPYFLDLQEFFGAQEGGVLLLNTYVCNSKYFEILDVARVNKGVGKGICGGNRNEDRFQQHLSRE